ncbi:hypothetical protein MZG50_22955, partial [Escherichia coli]|nr:hypothetical protein [Escherichia coli]MCK2951646.1 hypothetical protein [Escherichia coli]MCK2966092.1 hypothetical protein [Escherichia coli]MCK2970882.1 hypothetical protein [Escherichia coli]
FCGACGNNRTNRGGFQFAAARLPWFDSRVTSGELDNLQAIKVKEGFCLIGNQSGTNRVFMLRRTDLKPFVWKNEIGPSSYAQTRGCHNLAFFYKDELSVVDIQGLQHV